MDHVGVVIIGRNEGGRLKGCLRSVLNGSQRFSASDETLRFHVVYVDSGSTDGSVDAACRAGADVVQLSPPFTAARGRNAGLQRLLKLNPALKFVQFVDGDVELAATWLTAARALLDERPDDAVICGRLRERYPEHSIYNKLCDAEWDRPPGETAACGGIAMMRVQALQKTGGFREDLIAGEEPELCLRLRRDGWKIRRTDDDMGLHDAAMIRFAQWWRRSTRAGHGYAQSAWLHGCGPERYRVREVISIALWGTGLPAAAVLAAPFTKGLSLVALGIYPVQYARILRGERKRGRSTREARQVALFTLLGKLAQMQGLLRFACDLARGRDSLVIEYKRQRAGPSRHHSNATPDQSEATAAPARSV